MKGLLLCVLIVFLVVLWHGCESKRRMPKGYKECLQPKHRRRRETRLERPLERSLDSNSDDDSDLEDDPHCNEDGGCPRNCTCHRRKHVCIPKTAE
ncbi:uncharacterized protein LOC119170634 isoform X4 [Rhipicephalus microplus]|uniref:uncharacterized protein LOC119170634 isoform X4 n=1 Tax=Rhipicephalus microplus TaxID=6941 RepID=UPI003F6C3C1C